MYQVVKTSRHMMMYFCFYQSQKSDLDEMPTYAAFYLDVHCFQMYSQTCLKHARMGRTQLLGLSRLLLDSVDFY